MDRFSDVTEDFAMKLLSEVSFDLRFNGTKFHAMSGGIPVVFTELQEVKDFLHVAPLPSLLTVGGGGTVNYVDWTKLIAWVEEVFGDQELARAIGEEIEKGNSYVKTMGPIKNLIEERLLQCRALLQSKEMVTK
jgi:hypothetical protein